MGSMRNVAGALAVTAFAAVAAAGCGGEKTDVSDAVEQENRRLGAAGVKLDCPKEVDGGEGTEFDCDLTNERTDKKATVKLKVVKRGDDLFVDTADQAAYGKALQQVGAQPQQ